MSTKNVTYVTDPLDDGTRVSTLGNSYEVGLFHLFTGLTTYFYRGYNPVTKYQQDIPV